jgi:hypothetical protein
MRRLGAPRTGAAGLALFAAATLGCAAANSLAVLLVARGIQAVGGAAALVAAFSLLAAGRDARRLWLATAVLASAIGPALGGALTQAFNWRAIFLTQAPVAALAALASLAENQGTVPTFSVESRGAVPPFSVRAGVALGLLSAALSAVLFLLVLLLVAGWSEEPLRAAVAVTVIPAGALVGSRVALPSLAGGLLPERDSADAARLLTLRHLGIAVALAVLAPVVSHDLDAATQRARERGVALVLDAPLDPLEKVKLAPALLAGVESRDPRAGLRDAVARPRGDVGADERAAYDKLGVRADETLTTAVGEAFRTAFIVTGALALLAALLLAGLGGLSPQSGLALGAAVATLAAYAVLHASLAPEPVHLQDPCEHRDLPGAGGIGGFLQDRALELLDSTACRLHASREELVLALADDQDRRRFEDRHGVDPRSLPSLLGALIGR